jgi:hypothetical protein
MSPDAKKKNRRLYVSDYIDGIVDVFSVPKYSLVGQITRGIKEPEGLAVDTEGNLYVANRGAGTITVYKRRGTRPSLTLTDSDGPLDVAVGKHGYVYASDYYGGIEVYAPGATSPIRRLTSPNLIEGAFGVAVSPSNNVYADGDGSGNSPAVVEFVNAKGSGKNLGLQSLVGTLTGLIVDHNYLIVSQCCASSPGILIYPPGQTSPSSSISVDNVIHPAINKTENKIYVPTAVSIVGVYDYPSGMFVTNIRLSGSLPYASGAALSPAPKHE